MTTPASDPHHLRDEARPTPPASAGVLCPFCGTSQAAAEIAATGTCKACRNRMDPMARIATHNAMGPWFVRDLTNPFAPGCSYETLAAMCARGRVKLVSVVRGPTTQQFWKLAAHTPGVAVLLGQCHACAEHVKVDDQTCPACHAQLRPPIPVGVGRFMAIDDRQQLGLPPVIVWQGAADPHAALDGLAMAMGHAAAQRISPSADAAPTEPALTATGQRRLLAAGFVVATLLLIGLALWAVVLPAMGVATGVEEITGLRHASRGSAEHSAVATVAQADAAIAAPDASPVEPSMDSDPAAENAPSSDGPIASPVEEAVIEPADEHALSSDEAERIDRLHQAARAGSIPELLALREAIAETAERAFGQAGIASPEFAAKWPMLAAMDRWAQQRLIERAALDPLRVP